MASRRTWGHRLLALSLGVLATAAARAEDAGNKAPAADGKVSYYKQIRPIFQAQCQGCHQPSKAGGGYVMTAFDRLLAGGESDLAAIVPKDPAESHLLEQITPEDGKALMPQGKPPLARA